MDAKTILATLTRLVLASIAGTLVKDGLLQASGTQTFIGAGMLVATGMWGLWNGYGKDIAKASLDILRARVLNAAAIANAHPASAATALSGVVAHVVATSPEPAPVVAAVPPVASVIALAIGLTLGLGWPGAAHAQTRQPSARPLTGDPIKDIGNAIHPDIPAQSGQSVVSKDLLDGLNEKLLSELLADVSYADARAHVVGNVVTIPCWDAWKTLLTQQNSPLKDDAGNVMTKPDPHVITTAEFASEILRQLQPDSSLSLGCAPMLQAMQKDISTMIGAVLSGGALGLFKLPIGIP